MKRQTETSKWDDSWFRRLKPEHKALWDYLCCKCDNSGVWLIDWEDACFRIGLEINKDVLDIINTGKVRVKLSTDGNYLLISGFVEFQVGNIHSPQLTNLQKNCITLIYKHIQQNRFTKEDFLITGSLPVNYLKATSEDIKIQKHKDIKIQKHNDIKDGGVGEGPRKLEQKDFEDMVKEFRGLGFDDVKIKTNLMGCHGLPEVEVNKLLGTF